MEDVDLASLNCDIVQAAHHGQNGVDFEFYKELYPRIALFPTLRNGSGTMTPAAALTAADGPLRKPGTGWHAYALRSTAPKMVIRCLNKMLGSKAFDPGILNNYYIKNT